MWGIPLILPAAKLYDFGLYVDRGRARESKLRRAHSGDAGALLQASPDFYQQLRDADDVGWTLVVRVSCEGALGKGWGRAIC